MHGTLHHQGHGASMETSDKYTHINREIRHKLPIIYSHWISEDYKSARDELHLLLEVLRNEKDIPMFLGLFDSVIPQITEQSWKHIFQGRSEEKNRGIENKHRKREKEAIDNARPMPSVQFKKFIMQNLPKHLRASAAETSSSHEQHLCALLESLHSRISALEARRA